MSSRRRDVAGRAPAHREYPRNETQCRRSGRYPPPAGSLIAPAGTAVRSLARCPHPADTAGQVAHRAIVGRDHNADAPPAWSRVRTSPDHPPPPGYRRTRPEIPGMDDLRGSPAAPPQVQRCGQPPPAEFPRQRFHDRFVPLWATQDAAGAVANHDRREAHRCELSAAAQQAIFQLHPAAVVAPARPGRPSGYSRSMHRHIQRDHRPPLGLGHDFTADDEHANTGLPAPVVSLCHDLSRKRLFAELPVSRLSAPVERSAAVTSSRQQRVCSI